MCGNGLRCVALHVARRRGLAEHAPLRHRRWHQALRRRRAGSSPSIWASWAHRRRSPRGYDWSLGDAGNPHAITSAGHAPRSRRSARRWKERAFSERHQRQVRGDQVAGGSTSSSGSAASASRRRAARARARRSRSRSRRAGSRTATGHRQPPRRSALHPRMTAASRDHARPAKFVFSGHTAGRNLCAMSSRRSRASAAVLVVVEDPDVKRSIEHVVRRRATSSWPRRRSKTRCRRRASIASTSRSSSCASRRRGARALPPHPSLCPGSAVHAIVHPVGSSVARRSSSARPASSWPLRRRGDRALSDVKSESMRRRRSRRSRRSSRATTPRDVRSPRPASPAARRFRTRCAPSSTASRSSSAQGVALYATFGDDDSERVLLAALGTALDLPSTCAPADLAPHERAVRAGRARSSRPRARSASSSIARRPRWSRIAQLADLAAAMLSIVDRQDGVDEGREGLPAEALSRPCGSPAHARVPPRSALQRARDRDPGRQIEQARDAVRGSSTSSARPTRSAASGTTISSSSCRRPPASAPGLPPPHPRQAPGRSPRALRQGRAAPDNSRGSGLLARADHGVDRRRDLPARQATRCAAS